MAMADASTVTDTAIPVCLAKRGQQFSIHCSGATAVTQIGKQFPMSVTSNICYVNIASVASATFVVDDIDNCDEVGDTYGRLIIEVRGIRAQLDQTTS
jgi:hypothetical protein